MLNLKISAFLKALVESFPEKKEAIRTVIGDFERQIESTRREIDAQDANTSSCQP